MPKDERLKGELLNKNNLSFDRILQKKKQNMKDNVTITEKQTDINTKSWCSFNLRAKNQTFFNGSTQATYSLQKNNSEKESSRLPPTMYPQNASPNFRCFSLKFVVLWIVIM